MDGVQFDFALCHAEDGGGGEGGRVAELGKTTSTRSCRSPNKQIPVAATLDMPRIDDVQIGYHCPAFPCCELRTLLHDYPAGTIVISVPLLRTLKRRVQPKTPDDAGSAPPMSRSVTHQPAQTGCGGGPDTLGSAFAHSLMAVVSPVRRARSLARSDGTLARRSQ